MKSNEPKSPAAASGKYEEIVRSAGQVFATYGYARTQMADIASEANVALGTLYRYSASKEALFISALLFAIGMPSDQWRTIVGKTELRASDVRKVMSDWLSRIHDTPVLAKALHTDAPPNISEELFGVLNEAYDRIAKYHLAIRILDRSSREWPELAELFAAEIRAPLLEKLELYLETRSAQNLIGTGIDVKTTARLVVEVCAWFGMHRKFTLGPQTISDEAARQNSIAFLAAGLKK